MKAVIAVPATALLVVRAYRRKSLTPAGLVAAALTATVHALHPSALPFTLLVVFYVLGTQATRVKHDVKAGLTVSASGHVGGEGSRTATQVLANSAAASLLCLADVVRRYGGLGAPAGDDFADLVVVGIVANYAAVTADTLSSELGILAATPPRLITDPRRVVPRGTNGGVTLGGIAYGYAGSLAIAVTSVFFLPFGGSISDRLAWVVALSVWGMLGSLLDSLLGALLQASVVDRRTGKIVEAPGGVKVLTAPADLSPVGPASSSATPAKPAALRSAAAAATTGPEVELKSTPGHGRQRSREINTGQDILDNNQVNFLMASTMTVWAMLLAAALWRVDPAALLSPPPAT